MIKRKPLYNELMNNDTRIRIPDKSVNSYKLLLCIDYDPDKIIDTGILTTPEEAVSGRYLDYTDRIKDIIVANNNTGTVHSFEYIASRNRIDHKNRTVMIIGLSVDGVPNHATNIYDIRGSASSPNIQLCAEYSGESLKLAIASYNSGIIPSYMQPMVSAYFYKQNRGNVITAWNNFMSNSPWNTSINTLKWIRCLDISYIIDISSLAKRSTLITTDEGLEVFDNHPLIDIESIFADCSSLQRITHMNNYMLVIDGSTDATKSMFSRCPNLTYLELIGWNISTDVGYLSMFTPYNQNGYDFMGDPNNTYTLIVDETMKTVMMNFGGSNNTTEGIIRELLSNTTPVNGIYTVTYKPQQSD